MGMSVYIAVESVREWCRADVWDDVEEDVVEMERECDVVGYRRDAGPSHATPREKTPGKTKNAD